MRRSTFLLALLLVTLPACSDSTTDEVDSRFGTYSVQTFDGHALPFTMTDNTVLVSGTLTLKSDNTYTVALIGHDLSGADASYNDHGNFTISGDNITLHSASSNFTDATQGTFSGTTLTVNGDDGVYVLRKN